MSITNHTNIITPKLGEGIYLVKDIAQIFRLDYAKVRRWILGYWDGDLKENFTYAFGERGNKAINFYSLIEFYTFYKLREQGVSASKIKELHKQMAEIFSTHYPFAKQDPFYIEDRKGKKHLHIKFDESLLKIDKKHQFKFSFLETFLQKVEFDEFNLAKKYFPIDNSKNIVVDPNHQFGQPTIFGTNIKTQTIYNLYKGGESNENICILYNISLEKVQDAIFFYQKAA